MAGYLVPKELSDKVLMVGVRWKNHAPGGISSVVNTYSESFETFKYVVTAASRDQGKIAKLIAAIKGLVIFNVKMLFDREIRIVHVQGSHGASYDRKKLFVRLAKFYGKKVVWHMHASQFIPFYESRPDKESIVKTLNLADCLVVLSQSYHDFYKKIGVNEEKIVILNNIVPAVDHGTMVKGRSDKLHLLFLGEISERKGAFDIVKALGKYPDLAEKLEVRIGGNGEGDRLTDAISTARVSSSVFYEGWVSGRKKVDLLNWADIYILPSFNEGLPISILEALSYGCPVISTPVGGIEEVVHDETRSDSPLVNGKIVTPGDVDQIALAMRYYVENPDKIGSHSRCSLEIVKDYYPDKVFKDLVGIYNKCLNN